MRVWGRAPVGELLAGPAEGSIAEPFGKFEESQASGVIPSQPQRAEAADACGFARAKVTGPLVESESERCGPESSGALHESATSDRHLMILRCNVEKDVSPHGLIHDSKTREESDRTEAWDCNDKG